jgi:hypothetical protein
MIEINEETLVATFIGYFKVFSQKFSEKHQIYIFSNLIFCVEYSTQKRIFAADFDSSLNRWTVSNSSFSPRNYF